MAIELREVLSGYPRLRRTVGWLVGKVKLLTNLPAYDDDIAAGAGGLATGQMFQTTGSGAAPLNAAGIVMIKQ